MAARPDRRRRPKPPGSTLRREPADPAQVERDRWLNRRDWRTLRKAYLREHPLCEDCLDRGEVRGATVVHHKIDRRDRPDLGLAWANLRALCAPDHDRITRGRQDPSAGPHG